MQNWFSAWSKHLKCFSYAVFKWWNIIYKIFFSLIAIGYLLVMTFNQIAFACLQVQLAVLIHSMPKIHRNFQHNYWKIYNCIWSTCTANFCLTKARFRQAESIEQVGHTTVITYTWHKIWNCFSAWLKFLQLLQIKLRNMVWCKSWFSARFCDQT
jgi:hypothetical protein